MCFIETLLATINTILFYWVAFLSIMLDVFLLGKKFARFFARIICAFELLFDHHVFYYSVNWQILFALFAVRAWFVYNFSQAV